MRAQLDRERIAAELDHTDLVLRRGGHPALIAGPTRWNTCVSSG